MRIGEMFARNIEREIKNVITVGKEEGSQFEQQELEEYVVTKELQRHFRDFFAAYKKGILGETPKMGVWISGFFGSGKSHFLKMLYYLLSNKAVQGKTALQYFHEDGKVVDPMVLADIELAAKTPTDAILFNIDAKNSANSKREKDAIVRVFLKVFNDMQGYYGEIPKLADLERELEEMGRYAEFQQKFQEKKGKSWLENRHDLFFNQDIIVEVLVEMGVMSEPAARNWCESATNPRAEEISIEQFASRVKDYIAQKGSNRHVVFLVDEVGQYIGDDSKLMLNLQTVTEELGKACQGKAWILVTSQQDIDTVTNVKGNDFSKIQGRFDTRLSLSSANVDEVIKERIIKKTTTAQKTLQLLYEDKETTIKNLISFTGSAEKKLYANPADFAAVYPFVGYQFELLGKVLTAIRTQGASGKSLSEGERSMLSFFKEAANDYKGQDDNTLIPFNAFYRALDNYLDHSHRGVIIKAYENQHINPLGREDGVFAIEVLKTLFMVKYVREIDANLENITSLMVENIQEERSVLREKVARALRILEDELLIQRQGNIYIFLTNEEQETNRRIERQPVESQEVIQKTAEIIFDNLFTDKKYRYPLFGSRYTFGFDKLIDDLPYSTNPTNFLNLEVITSQADYDSDDATMSSLSMQLPGIIVQLPNQDDFIREIRTALKIENFLKKDTEAKALAQYDAIKVIKGNEAKERLAIAKSSLEDALREANIFINSHKAEIGAKDVTKRMDDALENLVRQTYTKLNYIDKPMDESDTKKMMQQADNNAIDLFAGGGEANQHALTDMLNYITAKTGSHGKISLKMVKDHFQRAPYGFVDEDIFYLVARLFKRGDIALTLQGEYVTLANHQVQEVLDYIQKKVYLEKLMLEKRERVSDKDKKIVRDLMKELYGNSTASDDEDALMSTFVAHAQTMLEELIGFAGQLKQAAYPGRQVVEIGIRLLNGIRSTKTAAEFFQTAVKNEDSLLDFIEDYEKVRNFFTGSQKQHFDEARKTYQIYEESQNYLAEPALEKIALAIRDILQNQKPYRLIKDLPGLRDEFNTAYEEILTAKAEPVKDAIENCRARVFAELENKPYKDQKASKFQGKFTELREQADHSNNINTLMSLSNQAEAVHQKYLNEIAAEDTRLAREAEEKAQKEHRGNIAETVEKPAVPTVDFPQEQTYQPKKTKYFRIGDIAGITSLEIKNEADIDLLFQALKAKLLQELKDRDSIHIDF